MTLGELKAGEFFVFAPVDDAAPALCLVLPPRETSGGGTAFRTFVGAWIDELELGDACHDEEVVHVTPCKVCRDSASGRSGVLPCPCHTL